MIRMRPISVANFVSVFLIAASVTGWAQFGSSYSTPIEFARNRLPEGINWSSSLNLTDTGLVTQTVNQAGAFWTF
jgi:hypothetical protein